MAKGQCSLTEPSPPNPLTPQLVQVATLRLQSSAPGTFPFAATVLPRQGQVPTGSTLASSKDSALRASILSRWSDGSAAVVVVASSASVTANGDTEFPLQRVSESDSSAGAALTPADIGKIIKSLNLTNSLGGFNLTDFTAPERIWWANAQTICARYRRGLSGHSTLEAVIDIQAWAGGRALVEVVVENGKMVTASPVKPNAASYASATLTINGALIATVNGNGAPEGNHAAFRAWYGSAWVDKSGAISDPKLRVTQIHAELQQHPLLFKCDQAANYDLNAYASDAYTPWGAGRHRFTNMGGGGDHPSIGSLPQWEARALQGGDYRAWRAVEASALSVLSYGVNYRDSVTGLVPTFDELAGKSQQANWPIQHGPNSDDLTWETAHHPAAGLMAFVARPSPVFIEIAQKVAVWNGTWSQNPDGGPSYDTGVFGAVYQIRGAAWGIRSLAHALFLTPAFMAWKASAITSLAKNFQYQSTFSADPKAKLNITWENRPGNPYAYYKSIPRVNMAGWQFHYLVTEVHKAASAKLLTGEDQIKAENFATWAALQPVRWINEQANGGWRFLPYVTVLGRAGESSITLNSFDKWGEQRADWMTDQPASVSGGWFSAVDEATNTYAGFVPVSTAGAGYIEYFWAALVAAVERKVDGGERAWNIVQSNITNLPSWRTGFAAEPRWGSTPRTGISDQFESGGAELPMNIVTLAAKISVPGFYTLSTILDSATPLHFITAHQGSVYAPEKRAVYLFGDETHGNPQGFGNSPYHFNLADGRVYRDRPHDPWPGAYRLDGAGRPFATAAKDTPWAMHGQRQILWMAATGEFLVAFESTAHAYWNGQILEGSVSAPRQVLWYYNVTTRQWRWEDGGANNAAIASFLLNNVGGAVVYHPGRNSLISLVNERLRELNLKSFAYSEYNYFPRQYGINNYGFVLPDGRVMFAGGSNADADPYVIIDMNAPADATWGQKSAVPSLSGYTLYMAPWAKIGANEFVVLVKDPKNVQIRAFRFNLSTLAWIDTGHNWPASNEAVTSPYAYWLMTDYSPEYKLVTFAWFKNGERGFYAYKPS